MTPRGTRMIPDCCSWRRCSFQCRCCWCGSVAWMLRVERYCRNGADDRMVCQSCAFPCLVMPKSDAACSAHAAMHCLLCYCGDDHWWRRWELEGRRESYLAAVLRADRLSVATSSRALQQGRKEQCSQMKQECVLFARTMRFLVPAQRKSMSRKSLVAPGEKCE